MSNLFELLKKIEAKPGLYLGTASITHLRMFIVGYRFARSEMNLPTTEAESDFYKSFQPWLQLHLQVRTVNSWDKIILLQSIDEKAAFNYFFQLLETFCQRDRTQDVDPILVSQTPTQSEKVA
jgi:hypothetical protein